MKVRDHLSVLTSIEGCCSAHYIKASCIPKVGSLLFSLQMNLNSESKWPYLNWVFYIVESTTGRSSSPGMVPGPPFSIVVTPYSLYSDVSVIKCFFTCIFLFLLCINVKRHTETCENMIERKCVAIFCSRLVPLFGLINNIIPFFNKKRI